MRQAFVMAQRWVGLSSHHALLVVAQHQLVAPGHVSCRHCNVGQQSPRKPLSMSPVALALSIHSCTGRHAHPQAVGRPRALQLLKQLQRVPCAQRHTNQHHAGLYRHHTQKPRWSWQMLEQSLHVLNYCGG
ncbi:hypothetical protein BX667DRAFT_155790 [Coemansia mojavensis]|nr:hypothetical protein BX667DRAFT_155790 [Coemansia mojavensis]